MASGAIIIYLNWLGSRQAVSVRPIGLSCVEAVKDWVASLRQNSEPFEIAGLKNLASGQTIWATALPDNLGSGVPQQMLQPGGDYEVILSSGSHQRASLAAPIFVEPPPELPPIYVEAPIAYNEFRTAHIPIDPLASRSPARVYQVQHPIHGGADFGSPARHPLSLGGTGFGSPAVPQSPFERHLPLPVHKHVTNIYYLDEFGNRISGPEAVADDGHKKESFASTGFHSTTGSPRSPKRSSTPPGLRSSSTARATTQSRPPRLSRSGSTGDLWDRLATPKAERPEPQQARKDRLPEGERQEAIERLLKPRANPEPDDDEGFDPNLRTVYRKMTPEDLDMFVYRMYAPHKHSAPRRDIYDEQKEIERRMNTFRDDIPVNKPPMDFRRGHHSYEEDEEDDRGVMRLTEKERADAAERLYKAAKAHQDKKAMLEQEHIRQEQAKIKVHTIKPSEMKALKERLYKLPKPPPEEPKKKEIIISKGGMKKRCEQWSKPKTRKTEPEVPGACEKKRVKMDRESYNKLMEKLMLPNDRIKLWRADHPIVEGKKRLDELKKQEGPSKWQPIW